MLFHPLEDGLWVSRRPRPNLLGSTVEPCYGRGVTFWTLNFSRSEPLARVATQFLCSRQGFDHFFVAICTAMGLFVALREHFFQMMS